MENYPTNRRSAQSAEPTPETPKKVEKIVSGAVTRRKKPLGKRFVETFVGGDTHSVGQYIMFEVLLPAIKDTIADVVSQGIERTLFGEARSSSRRTGYRPGGSSSSYTNYSRYASPSTARREEPQRGMSPRAKAHHDFDEIILPTRAEADQVIERLFDLVSQYECATVSDLYELVGISSSFTDNKWGWTDLRGVGATRVRDGYLLDLPRPDPLKD